MTDNGLIDFRRIYEAWANPEYVQFIELTKADVQRHPAVTEILSMYGD
jgi:phosphate starvation-inducible protein PhoH